MTIMMWQNYPECRNDVKHRNYEMCRNCIKHRKYVTPHNHIIDCFQFMDSPFQQHLGTNYVPTVNEANQIQDSLEISDQSFHCINAEINQLQQQVDLLQEKQSILHGFAGGMWMILIKQQ
ncbi:hypothetical protein BDQ17DRAFT_1433300 [Cyathus striatus]|nr:hypothetical protein BDQ17DRAFT_1433300 [Cyathus striatus]